MRRKFEWIAVGAVVLLVLVFAFLDLRAALSNTRVDYQLGTSWGGKGFPDTMAGACGLALSVIGESSLTPDLERELSEALRASGQFADVEVLSDIAPKVGGAYLVVRVREKGGLWTPLYATGRVVVAHYFSSHGDMTQLLNDEPIRHSSADSPVFIDSRGTYTLTDTSWGLTTFPGYDHLLADQLASRISDTTLKLYKPR